MNKKQATAYISSDSKIMTTAIDSACKQLSIKTIIRKSDFDHKNEIISAKADMVFIQASIVERTPNLIQELRIQQKEKHSLVIVHGTRSEVADFAREKGADSFLPIPFRNEQLESILRLSLNLPKKILIFTKKPKNNIKIKEKLEKEQFTIINAFSKVSAFEISKRAFPDMICVDSSCKTESETFIQAIKNQGELFHIPIVFLSNSSEALDIENSFKIGADEVLVPPFDSKTNIRSIMDIVNPTKGIKNNILIVDDSNVMRNFISRILTKNGYNVITADTGKDGIEKAIKHNPSLITSDYDMPEMNGWEMCAELKKNNQTQKTPIIMITSRDNKLDQKKTKAIGINNYIVKPFEEAQLIAAIKFELKKYKKELEAKELSKYLSKDTIANVENNLNQSIEPKEKFISVLFTDIVGFTPMCENLTSYDVIKILNNYFEEMVDILHENNAIIDKFIGDAIMARFDSGNPKTDAYNAVAAASQMIEKLKELNKKQSPPIKIRIGINSGDVIIGNIGCQKYRLDYTIIGDNVNIAQRLENAAPHMKTLISEETYNLTKETITVIEKKELSLKGKKQIITGYTIDTME